SAFVELADQVEQELAAGLGEREIAELVQDQEVEAGDQVCGAALPFSPGFCVQFVDQVDDVEEPATAAVADAGARDADREMGLSGSGAADQHEVALMIQKLSSREVTDQGLVDL